MTETTPPVSWAMVVLSTAIIMIFLTSFAQWIRLWRKRRSLFGTDPLVDIRPRFRPYWSAVYAILFYVLVIAVSIVLTVLAGAVDLIDLEALRAAAKSETPGEASSISVPQILISSLSMVGATLASLAILRFHRTDAIQRIGLIPNAGLLRMGVGAAWLILPPTMVMMGLVSTFQEYSHPVLDALKPAEENASPDFILFAVLFFSTALVTPIVEEFWFRGLLQGGLQRLADLRTDLQAAQARRADQAAEDSDTSVAVSHENPLDTHIESGNPYQPPPAPESIELATAAEAPVTLAGLDEQANWTPTAIWPIFVSSFLFAIAHWGQGLAPIPLFVLAYGLGYLYRQTGSLVPCIVVHLILNAFTMSATFIELLQSID